MSVLRFAFASLLASTALASAAFAQEGPLVGPVRGYQVQQQQQPTTRPLRDGVTGLGQTQDVIREPRFIVEAVSFQAIDESGPNSPGADEVYAVFRSGGNVMVSRVYESVDTGEDPRFFEAQQRCISPAVDADGTKNGRWSCAAQGARGPVRFEAMLYELDPHYRSALGEFCVSVGGDDLDASTCATRHSDVLFRHTFTYEVSQILARLDPSCRCFTETARYTEEDWRGDLAYEFTFRITRVDDGRDPPAVEIDPYGGGAAVHSSGVLNAALNQHLDLDAGAILPNNGDFSFTRAGGLYRLTPGGGARIWVGGASARGRAACAAGAANHTANAVTLPAVGAYACYITSDGRVGEMRIDNLVEQPFGGGATLTLSYTTWQ